MDSTSLVSMAPAPAILVCHGVEQALAVGDWYNLLKRRGCSVVNLFPREVQRVLNLFPRELIESTPKDFPNANLKLHQRPDPRPKT